MNLIRKQTGKALMLEEPVDYFRGLSNIHLYLRPDCFWLCETHFC